MYQEFPIFSSFSDASSAGLLFDTGLMISGYALMFLYTVTMLGRPNRVEQRAYLAMAGISAVGMGMVVSLGLTMAFGFFYTTIHGVLPFLAMGESYFSLVMCGLIGKFEIIRASGKIIVDYKIYKSLQACLAICTEMCKLMG